MDQFGLQTGGAIRYGILDVVGRRLATESKHVPMRITKIGIVAACIVIVGLAGILWSLRINLDLPSAGESAKELLAKAGGADRVCEEARQIFQEYGVTNQTFFYDGMLTKYPAVASLGRVDYIMPGPPAHIKIRAGTHLDGFTMKIVDTNTDAKLQRGADTLEIVKGCIYVSR